MKTKHLAYLGWMYQMLCCQWQMFLLKPNIRLEYAVEYSTWVRCRIFDLSTLQNIRLEYAAEYSTSTHCRIVGFSTLPNIRLQHTAEYSMLTQCRISGFGTLLNNHFRQCSAEAAFGRSVEAKWPKVNTQIASSLSSVTSFIFSEAFHAQLTAWYFYYVCP